MIRKLLFIPVLVLLMNTNYVCGQAGGDNVFSFLNVPSSARTTALGGQLITIQDDDISLAFHNPASINSMTNRALSFNYNFRYSGVNNGYVGYGFAIPKYKINLHTSVLFSNYGTFKLTDFRGNEIGTFRGSDYAFVLGASRQLNERFSLGVNSKWIFSQLESYTSSGLAFDIGGIYQIPDKRLSIAVVAKNIGTQLKTYAGTRERIPLDLQVGISKKLRHLPFRYSFVFHHLHQWNLLYPKPNISTGTINNTEPSKFSLFADNLFRHVIINGEFLLGKKENLRLRIGYNHMLKREMSLSSLRSMAGFSGGFEFRIKQFSLAYGFAFHHLEGSVKHVSLRTNLDWFKGKKV